MQIDWNKGLISRESGRLMLSMVFYAKVRNLHLTFLTTVIRVLECGGKRRTHNADVISTLTSVNSIHLKKEQINVIFSSYMKYKTKSKSRIWVEKFSGCIASC